MDRYDIHYCSPGQITQYLGLQFKNYRILSKITQKEIAEKQVYLSRRYTSLKLDNYITCLSEHYFYYSKVLDKHKDL